MADGGFGAGLLQGVATGIGNSRDRADKRRALEMEQQKMQQQQNQFNQTMGMEQSKFDYQKEKDAKEMELEGPLKIAQAKYYEAQVAETAQKMTTEDLRKTNARAAAVIYADDPALAYKVMRADQEQEQPGSTKMWPEEYTPEARAKVQIAAGITGDALKYQQTQAAKIANQAGPEAQSQQGKVQADIRAGILPENTENRTPGQMKAEAAQKKAAAELFKISNDTLQLTGDMKTSLDKVPGGLKGPIMGKIGQYTIGGQETAQSANQLALRARTLLGMIGSLSDPDREFLVKIAGGVNNSKEAMDTILTRMNSIASKGIAQAVSMDPKLQKLQYKAAKQEGKLLPRSKIQEILADHPGMTEEEVLNEAEQSGYILTNG